MPTPVIMPRQGQSVESCILTEWKVAVGDEVKEGDVLAVIETDKASFDLEASASGKILGLFWEADDDIPVLANVAVIGEEGEEFEEFRPSDSTPAGASIKTEASDSVESKPSSTGHEPVASELSDRTAPSSIDPAPGVSPRARKLARKYGMDPESIRGSGPDGRVIERDVQSFADGRPRMSRSALFEAREHRLVPPNRGGGLAGMALASEMKQPGAIEGAEVEPVKGIRKVIAERMIHSLRNTAQLTLHSSFELTVAQKFREQRLSDGKPKVSLNDLVAFGIIQSLKEHPQMNAHFLGDRLAIFKKVHLGVAVDTPRGLFVPVVRDSSDMSIETLSSAVKKIALACREGTIPPDDLTGGSFTLTNLGMLGVESFTPVLNAPEVGILGVGGIVIKPKRLDSGEVVFADYLPLSLTIDHQAVDGAPAARFLQTLVAHLENNPGELHSSTSQIQ